MSKNSQTLLQYCSSTLASLSLCQTSDWIIGFFICWCWQWLDARFFFRILIDSWYLCIPQIPGGHLLCLPTHADDGLGAVCGSFCEKTSARERTEAARGNVFLYLKVKPAIVCLISALTSWFPRCPVMILSFFLLFSLESKTSCFSD